jgi:UDP-N-acetylmuramate dehydrogenase
MISTVDIQKTTSGALRLNEPMARYSTFGVGGPADYYLEPLNQDDLVSVVTYFSENGVPFVLCSNKSNILVSEEGFRGAVINIEPGLSAISGSQNVVSAQAGAKLGKLIETCISRGLSGLETFAGIGGTVGGAVATNRRSSDVCITDLVQHIEILRNGRVTKETNVNGSHEVKRLVVDGDIVLSVKFTLTPSAKNDLLMSRRRFLIQQNEKQPVNIPSVGSIFRDSPQESAEALIMRSGVKKKTHGGARIFDAHPNMLCNSGNASPNDLFRLIRIMHEAVLEKHGVNLEYEVRCLGFEEELIRTAV